MSIETDFKGAKWTHEETNPPNTFTAAMATAAAKSWGSLSNEEASRQFRALMLMSLQAGRLNMNKPPAGVDGKPRYGFYAASDYRDKTSLWIASTVLRTLPIIAIDKPNQAIEALSVRTTDGKPSEVIFEEFGALPWGVVVLAVAVASIAAVYIAKITGDIVDRQLAREADIKSLVAAQAGAITLIDQHALREKAANASLPWEEQEQKVLDELLKRQQEVATRKQIPMPEPFTGAIQSLGDAANKTLQGAGGAAATVIDSGGKSAATAIDSASLPLIVIGLAGGAYLLTR